MQLEAARIGGAIEIGRAETTARPSDRTIATIAKEGIYRPSRHLEQAKFEDRVPGGDNEGHVDAHVRRLEGQTTVSVSIGDDDEGYSDRECPPEECLFQFKALHDDWKEKVRDEEVFYPNCRHTAHSGCWWTREQMAHAREVALAQVRGTISGALKKDAASWNRRTLRKSFILMTMKVGSQPHQVPLPPAAMRLKITCPARTCRHAVVGVAYSCPACGHNAAGHQF